MTGIYLNCLRWLVDSIYTNEKYLHVYNNKIFVSFLIFEMFAYLIRWSLTQRNGGFHDNIF